jgi:hypothetical protein
MDNTTSLMDILETVAQETALESGFSVPTARARVRSALLGLGEVPRARRTWREFTSRIRSERRS